MSWYAELKSVFSSKSLATSATSEQSQLVTMKKDLRHACDKLRHEEDLSPQKTHVTAMSQNVAVMSQTEKHRFIKEKQKLVEICRNVADVAEVEKSLLQTKYTATYFSANAQSRPEFCIHCSAWT